MAYRFQVYCLVDAKTNKHDWRDVHPSSGQPYEYETKEEAEHMARICYGNDSSIVRVVEVVS